MSLRFLSAGESHGLGMITILEGFPAGLSISLDSINVELLRRQSGFGSGPRMKIEKDRATIISGLLEGKTIGSPIAIIVDNKDHSKWQGKNIAPFTIPRPGHADMTGTIKYGYNDLRPALERASARETVSRVAMGSICKQFLSELGITVGGYISSIGEVFADCNSGSFDQRYAISEGNELRCPDESKIDEFRSIIQDVIKSRDTLGGTIEVFVLGVPPGLGSYVHWDRRLEAKLGAALLSVQAIKGVEFGPAFQNAQLRGTEVQDGIYIEDGNIIRKSNRAGGLEGGISNGEPIFMRVAMKPIATTLTPQSSVDLSTGEEVATQYERSDFCPVPRAIPILESMVAYVIADSVIEKVGGDSMDELLPRYKTLRKMRLNDFHLHNTPHLFWNEY